MIFSLFDQVKYELTSIFRGYPEFVLKPGGELQPGELPVFTFHTIDPDLFERQLVYLKTNGYQTLAIQDYVDALAGRIPVPRRAVLLTIDDGRSSFWRFAYPLLKKHGLRATLFVIPGFTPETAVAADNLLTLGDTPQVREQLKQIDPQDQSLCSWDQLKEMAYSGAVDIESHTLFHREVFTSPEVVGWVGPQTSFIPHYSPVTAWLDFDDVGKTWQPETLHGLPLFKSTPLMSAVPALKLPEGLSDFCRKAWSELPVDLRASGDWQSAMTAELERSGWLQKITVQSHDDMRATIQHDLDLARRLIQTRAHPEAGQHLCLPFTYGAPLVIEVARELGLHSCFWGTIPGKRCNRPGVDPLQIVRVKNDFIFRLPGQQRWSLLSIYIEKIRRRLQGQPAF